MLNFSSPEIRILSVFSLIFALSKDNDFNVNLTYENN